MFKPLFLAFFLIAGQAPQTNKEAEFGAIAGSIVAPEKVTISQPIQVILLAPQYVDMWNVDVQKRLDLYWERYKPAFAQKKELFIELSRNAYQESLQFVVSRMTRDLGGRMSNFREMSTPDGK